MSENEADPNHSALNDDAFIIRGGLMELGPLRNALQTSYVENDVYELSLFGEDELSVDEIVEAAQQPHPRLPQRKIRVSTVGKLRRAGFEPSRQRVVPHVVLRFDVSPTDSELEELVRLFDPPIDNPSTAK